MYKYSRTHLLITVFGIFITHDCRRSPFMKYFWRSHCLVRIAYIIITAQCKLFIERLFLGYIMQKRCSTKSSSIIPRKPKNPGKYTAFFFNTQSMRKSLSGKIRIIRNKLSQLSKLFFIYIDHCIFFCLYCFRHTEFYPQYCYAP